MKYIIPLARDSYNSYPQDNLEIVDTNNEYIHFQFSDSDRETAVLKKNLIKVLRALEHGEDI